MHGRGHANLLNRRVKNLVKKGETRATVVPDLLKACNVVKPDVT